MLPSSKVVVFIKDGYLKGTHKDSVLIDMSTFHPASIRNIAKKLSLIRSDLPLFFVPPVKLEIC